MLDTADLKKRNINEKLKKKKDKFLISHKSQ